MAQQETSALFSLNELMRLEDERVKNEIEARRRQAEAAEQRRIEAARIAREREAAALREQEEKRLRDEARAREEEVRLEAIRTVERERAGLDRLRQEALAAQREHERRLASLVGPETRSPHRRALRWGTAAASALLIASGAAYFGKAHHSDDHASEIQTMIASGRADNERMQRTIDEQNRKVRELEERLRAEPGAAETAPPTDAPPKVEKPRVLHRPPKQPPAAPPCTCDQHDPLCGCWKR